MTKKKHDPIVNAETPEGQRAGEAIVDTIENQLKENDPPEVRKTLDRLMKMGESRENAIRYIACAFSIEIYEIMENRAPYNEKRYIKNLKRLPTLPDE